MLYGMKWVQRQQLTHLLAERLHVWSELLDELTSYILYIELNLQDCMAYYNLIVTFNISLWLGFDNLGHVNLISCFMAQPAHLFEKFKFLPVAKIPLETLKKA